MQALHKQKSQNTLKYTYIFMKFDLIYIFLMIFFFLFFIFFFKIFNTIFFIIVVFWQNIHTFWSITFFIKYTSNLIFVLQSWRFVVWGWTGFACLWWMITIIMKMELCYEFSTKFSHIFKALFISVVLKNSKSKIMIMGIIKWS